jgi:basic membrane protein A
MSGSFSSGIKVLGVAEGGVDWAVDENNKSLITAKIKSAVEQARNDILSGKVVVHDFMSDSSCPY